MCQIWLRSDGRVEKRGIQTDRHTDKGTLQLYYYSRLSSLITCAHCTYPFVSDNFYLSLQRHQRSLGMCRHYYHQSTDWSELRPSMSLCKIEVSVPLSIHFLAYWLTSFHHVFGRLLDLVPGISVLNNVLTMCSSSLLITSHVRACSIVYP